MIDRVPIRSATTQQTLSYPINLAMPLGPATFSDTLALVRRHLWREQGFPTSRRSPNIAKPKPALQKAILYALCNAA